MFSKGCSSNLVLIGKEFVTLAPNVRVAFSQPSTKMTSTGMLVLSVGSDQCCASQNCKPCMGLVDMQNDRLILLYSRDHVDFLVNANRFTPLDFSNSRIIMLATGVRTITSVRQGDQME